MVDKLGFTPVSRTIAEERGEKESIARVLLVYSQLDKSKREAIEKPVTRHKYQFYASKTRHDPIRERVRELA